MKRALFSLAFFVSLFVMNAQKSSLGITFGGAINVGDGMSLPTDYYFNPNMQAGVTGKTIFFKRMTVEASLLYGIRQLNLNIPISDLAPAYNDQCYSSTLSLSPVIGFRIFEVGIHNLNIGVGAEPTIYFPHAASEDGIGKYKNRFDVPVLAKLTYGISGVDLALTYKHSFTNRYNVWFDDSKIQELMLSIYLPLGKK